ncbi:MAG: MFS transporter [Anaerolineae bacterium]
MLTTRPRAGAWLRRLQRTVTCATADMPADVQRGLALFSADGLFIALSFAFYNSFVSLYLLGFGASNNQIGLMTSLSSLAGIAAYLLATRITTALGSRKRAVVFTRVSSRLNLLALAAVPFFFSGQAAVYVTTALMCLQTVLESVGSPAWTALVADIVPLGIRARYVASRNITKSAARTVAVALAGQLIHGLGFPGGYQAAFVCGAVIGMGAAIAYSRIPAGGREREPAADERLPVSPSVKRGFGLYMAARAIWALGYYVSAPFFPVYMVRELGGDAGTVGVMASVGSITAVLGLLYFSRLVEGRGLRLAWLLGSILEAAVPWLWALAPSAWFGVVPAALDGVLLAGLELVNLNTLLLLSPAQGRTQYAASSSAILSVAMMIGPLVGGALSDAYGFRLVFVLGGVLSLVGCLLYSAFVPEPAGWPARPAVAGAAGGVPPAA